MSMSRQRMTVLLLLLSWIDGLEGREVDEESAAAPQLVRRTRDCQSVPWAPRNLRKWDGAGLKRELELQLLWVLPVGLPLLDCRPSVVGEELAGASSAI